MALRKDDTQNREAFHILRRPQGSQYCDIYSEDILKQSIFVKYYNKLLDARDRILETEESLSATVADSLH